MKGELGSDLEESNNNLSPESENGVEVISINKLVIGKQYDILDASQRWCEGEVNKQIYFLHLACLYSNDTSLSFRFKNSTEQLVVYL